MNTMSYRSAFRIILGALVTAGLLQGCASPQTGADTSQGAAAKAPAAAPAPAPAPAPPPAPELTPAQAKAQAQRLALEAVDQLQNGDEAAARLTLDKAIALDPANDLAKKLLDQIKADAQKELGPVFFRYTVQRDDSLSKLAQQYLGDRFRFYILAKYNDMASPNKLAAGQVIKIPGRAPATPPPRGRRRAGRGSRRRAGGAPRPSRATTSPSCCRRARSWRRSGNLEGAYAAFSEAAKKTPGNAEAVRRRDASQARCCAVSIARPRRRSSGRTSTSRSPSGIASSSSIPTTRRPSSSASARSSSRRR